MWYLLHGIAYLGKTYPLSLFHGTFVRGLSPAFSIMINDVLIPTILIVGLARLSMLAGSGYIRRIGWRFWIPCLADLFLGIIWRIVFGWRWAEMLIDVSSHYMSIGFKQPNEFAARTIQDAM